MRLKPLVMLGLMLAAAFAGDAASRTQHSRLLVTKNGSGSGNVKGDAPGDIASVPINCGSICSGLYKAVTITLTATADGGSTFDGWGGACSGTSTCSVYVSGTDGVTIGVSATFSSTKRYMVSVATAGSGTGTVQSAPAGIACPGACADGFLVGTSVVLTATPDAASLFTGWGGACTGADPICTVTMDQEKSVTATFAQKAFAVSVRRSGTGSGTVTSGPAGIACGDTCSAEMVGSARLVAAPAAGSAFTGWSGACRGKGSCTLTLDAPKTVTARFDDARAPTVKARPSSGKRGGMARLRYVVSDASGKVRARVTVLRSGRVLAALLRPFAPTGTGDVSWRVPARLEVGGLRFCVVAVDPAGNKSAPSCAPLKIT